MRRFVQVRAGRVVGVVEVSADLEAAPAGLVASETAGLGDDFDGAAFAPHVETQAEASARRLAEIDRETGMGRTMREALIDLLPAGKGAFLRAKEAEAANERGKLA